MTKKTKIVCTIGPSSWDPEVMRQMIENGMNCARVNGAFANPDELDKVANLVRSVSNKVSLMVDVKGPEIRLNKFANPIDLTVGQIIEIGNDENSEIYPANYKDIYKFVKPGQRAIIGDGDVAMVIEEIKGDKMICRVEYGEVLKPGKAFNLPGVDYSDEVLTEKDKINLRHAINTGWDFVSASFMNNKQSALYIKEFIGDAPMKIIAKIENEEGVQNASEILEIVDGIMIARGGLGVELGLEQVAIVQRELNFLCNIAGKPVITATQMLESMTEKPRPTRAEAGDVATAVMLGTDAVMLSGESSAGKYPVEAVKFLTKASLVAEEQDEPTIIELDGHATPTANAITRSAAELCINLENDIAKVVVVSKTGTTARMLARHMIRQPIYLFTSNEWYMRTAMLSRGIVDAFVFEGLGPDPKNRDNAVKLITEMIQKYNIAQKGEKILLLGKTPIDSQDFFPNVFEIIEI
ncbi:MAG: pyruvate kinase [Candidatus Dojkabacteria bacterium]|nr:MAG: pyruvate kinase [Candidatus Dojkabacteria bacterium]